MSLLTGQCSCEGVCLLLCVCMCLQFYDHGLINPQRISAARVTVLSLSVYVCVCYLANSYAVNVHVQSKIRIESKFAAILTPLHTTTRNYCTGLAS